MLFQPTPPARGATWEISYSGPAAPVSTHAPRAGGDVGGLRLVRLEDVSTHAPRAGGDSRAT